MLFLSPSEQVTNIPAEQMLSSSSSSSSSSCFPQGSESSGAQTEITPPHSPSKEETPLHQIVLSASSLLPSRASEQVSLVHVSEKTPRQGGFHLGFPGVVDDGGYESDSEGRGGKAQQRKGASNEMQQHTGDNIISKSRKKGPSFQLRSQRVDVAIPCDQASRHDLLSGEEAPVKITAKRPSAISLAGIPQFEFKPRVVKAAVGLGLGLPSNHPLRTPRANTMPEVSYPSHKEPVKIAVGSGLLPSRPFPPLSPLSEERQKLRLRPTILPDSPSPIDSLPPRIIYYRHNASLLSESEVMQTRDSQPEVPSSQPPQQVAMSGSATTTSTNPFPNAAKADSIQADISKVDPNPYFPTK